MGKKYIISCLSVFLISVCIIYGVYYIYASNNTEYSLDEVKIDFLFSLEQDIVSVNSLKNINIADIDNFIYSENTENSVNNLEKATLDVINNIKIVELEEEYYVANRLASRGIEDEIGSIFETTEEKYYRIFGDDYASKMGKTYYYPGGESQALQEMTSFTIQVWSLDSSDNWYKRTVYMQTHKNIEKTVKCIFSDLLELPEELRTPIKTIGCYNYREGYSNHTCGVAIDINWEENAEMTTTGVVTAGRYWMPYEDIYSITPESAMVEIFEKYGFGWGGLWTSKKDYMHFSYFNR